MKLVNCKTCGQQIAKNAKKCPHCGKRRAPIERNPFGTIVGLFFFIVFLFIFVGIIVSSTDETPAQPDTTQTANTNPTQTPEAVPLFEPIDIDISNWEITLTNFYFAESVEFGFLTEYRPGDGAKFAIVELTVKNIGTEPEVFLPIIAYGSDTVIKLECGDYTFTRSELLLSNDAISTEGLNPLVSASGIVCFEFPIELIDSDAPIELIISADWQEQRIPLR